MLRKISALIFAICLVVSAVSCGNNEVYEEYDYSYRYDMVPGIDYLDASEFEEARDSFEGLIEDDPLYSDAYIGLAKAYECLGRVDEAMSVLEEGFYNTKDSRLSGMANELNASGKLPDIEKLLSDTDGEPGETQDAVFFNELSSEPMVIEDKKLEEALRLLLEKPDGDICPKDFAGIYDLDLTGLGITDITPLSALTTLRTLYLGKNEITDLTPLSKLTRLTRLNINDNQIGDLSPLKNLTGLTNLVAGWNPADSVEPLSELKELTALTIDSTRITDITPLTKLTGLTKLSIGKNRISDLSPLKNLTALTVLYADNIGADSVEPLSGLKELKELVLSYNKITDIKPLGSLTALETLCLDNNGITDITPLRNLTSLKKLQLKNNNIPDTSPLEGLKELKQLDISPEY